LYTTIGTTFQFENDGGMLGVSKTFAISAVVEPGKTGHLLDMPLHGLF
jgi:hypothetical protein